MKKTPTLLFLSIFIYGQLFAQGENNIWIFGHSAGLDFNSGAPVPLNKQLGSNEGCATVSNAKGQLLFYSMGKTVLNRNGQVMPNGNNLVAYPTIRATQSSLIVPVVNSGSKYYLFSLEEAESADLATCRLSYSVIDMNLDGGLGDVESASKSVLIDQNLTEKMIAIPGSDCNIWLLVHTKGSNEFKAYSITEAGIASAPVLSNAGALTGPNAHLSGVMKIAPDRRTLAVCSAGDLTTGTANVTGVELMNFDPATGIVSNARTLNNNDLCYGASFSPDGSKLYVGGDRAPGGGQFLAQYDISLPTLNDIVNSKTELFLNPYPGFIKITDMRTGPDGRIYMNSATNLDYLDVIANPNVAGTGSNYTARAIHLVAGTTGHYGMPNVYTMPVPKDTAYYTHEVAICAPPDSLVLRGPAESFFFEWDDAATDSLRTVKQLGTYWVRSRTYCSVRVDTFKVTERIDLSFTLGRDTEICTIPYVLNGPSIDDIAYLWSDGSTNKILPVNASGSYNLTITKRGCTNTDDVQITVSNLTQSLEDIKVCKDEAVNLTLTANVPQDATVQWNTGSNSPSIQVTDTGTYWVTVSRGICKVSDTSGVSAEFCDCTYAFPSGFTPNNDGRNDKFRIIAQDECPISGYRLYVYNRWGQRVFSSDDPFKGWDGTQGGQPVNAGVYMYSVEFIAGVRSAKHQIKGEVTLVR